MPIIIENNLLELFFKRDNFLSTAVDKIPSSQEGIIEFHKWKKFRENQP